MAKTTLKITTPQGEFTRTTHTAYTHVVVRQSPRASEFLDQLARGEHDAARCAKSGGVHGRWIKDRGFAVTWHGSERAALKAAAAPYGYDIHATVIGVYPVTE